MRYAQLLQLIDHVQPKSIVEVGTWNGDRAIQMITQAWKYHDEVIYIGYDLFELATPETDETELNVKQHFTKQEVNAKLGAFAAGMAPKKKLYFSLKAGNTRETLPPPTGRAYDFAFIDGGHSIETIESDFAALSHCKTVVLDDYYIPDDENRCADTEKYGCNRLVERVGAGILPAADPMKDGGLVQMAVLPAELVQKVKVKTNLIVKTRNCVPDDDIQANIRHCMSLGLNRWPVLRPHDQIAVMCSAGPSLTHYYDELRDWKERGGRIVCVKHAHDKLLAEGIVPWACVLLDPRGHVQDFVANPHPEVNYVVASMCHPTTFDALKDAKVWIYHAAVGAGEMELLTEMTKTTGVKEHVLGGGSSSALRGFSVMHAAGFRDFHLYGYDSSYEANPDPEAKDLNGMPKYYKVGVNGRDFTTDSEKLAEVQDWQRAREANFEARVTVHGAGMIPHIERYIRRKCNEAFAKVFND